MGRLILLLLGSLALVLVTDPAQYMAMRCPGGDWSRYACKVAGWCRCGKDDDLFAAFERQCKWRAARPASPMMRDGKANP